MHTQSANTVKQRLHKLLSLLLAVVLVVGLVPAVTPVSRADSWATPYLDKLVGWGFMRADQAADHNKAMTRAEFMAVINRAYGYDQVGEIPFTDVRPSDWFYEDVCIAYNARYMAGTSETTASPNATLTREQAVVILGHNMLLEESNGENLNFTDARNISNWSRGLVKTASDQYIINGYADGSFRPKSQVTRGEMAALICNIIGTPLQEAGEQELGDVFGNVTITSAGVKLKNTTIAGDLYISGGVDLGDVELENVEVLGRIIVGGAGESEKGKASLILRNVQADKMVVDSLKDQYITMRVEGSTVIPEVTVKTSAYLEDNTPLEYGLKTITFDADGEEPKLDLAGRVKEVINVTPDSTIQVAKGTVEKLTVDERATESTIIIDRGTNVRELNLDTGTQVNGEGDIGSLNINAPGSTVEMLPDKIYIRPGLTGNIAGTVMDSTAAEEASRDPKILAGYPNAADVAPTSVKIEVKTNKKGTVHWAITTLADGSLGADELINPPSYGSKAVQRGSISVTAADTLTTGEATGLVSDGTYYISAVLVDEQGKQSPVKSTAFTTPDDSVPAFNNGYPRMTQTKPEESWVLVMPNKTCKLYYALFPAGATAPTKENMKTGALSGNLGYGVLDVTKNIESTFQVNDRTLGELKDYVLYLWLTDANGANSSAVVPVDFTTDDVTPPFFTTLPYVTKDGANSVNLSYEVNENATVYWAVVTPPSTPYPRPETGTTTVDLTSLYAKIQVKSGMHAQVSGNSRFTVGQTGTLNITGLEPETAYELYFVAQDEQGNYSVSVQHMTIHTSDENPPKVYVDFNRYTAVKDEEGNVIGKDPWVDTDIMLVFDEAIRCAATNEDFEELYNKVKVATTDDARRDAQLALADALSKCIKMYYSPSSPEKQVPSNVKVPTPNDNSWVLDYTQARVEADNEGNMIVTFPKEGLHLTSGGSYYFRVEGITDTTSDPNLMDPVKLDVFTIMFAEVSLEINEKLTGGSAPYVRGPKGEVPADSTKLAELHYFIKMTPLTTNNTEDNIFYDILFFPSETMQFDLYARVMDTRGTETTTDDLNVTKQVFSLMKDNKTASTVDKNGWVYIGNSGRTSAGYSANLYGNAFYKYDAGDLKTLKSLNQEYVYEFVLTVTYMQSTADPGAWTGNVDMGVKIAAGYQNNIKNLSGGVSTGGWNDFIKEGMTNGGKNVGNPDNFSQRHKFVDYTVPKFETEHPRIVPEADKAHITVQTTPPGMLYYVIAPAEAARDDATGKIITDPSVQGYSYKPSITVKWAGKDGHTEDARVELNQIPETLGIASVAQVGDQPGEKTGSGVNIDPVDSYISYPSSDMIQEPDGKAGFDKETTIWPDAPIEMKANATTFTVEGLTPETLYHIYFVMKSKEGQELSRVWVYRFETTPVVNPQIVVGRSGSSATFQIDNEIPSYLDYIVYTTQFLPTLFEKELQDPGSIGGVTLTDHMKKDVTAADKTSYGGLTLIQAMIQRYNGANKDYIGYSVFDALAGDEVKREVAAIIRQTSQDYNTLGYPTDSGTNVDMTEVNRKTQQINNMGDDAQHYVLVVGHHEAIKGKYEVADFDSFGAIDNLAKPVTKVPQYTGPTGPTAFSTSKVDATGKKWEGNLTLRFDGNLHQVVIEEDTSQPNGVQKTYKINSSSPDDNAGKKDSKSIVSIISKPTDVTLEVSGNSLGAASTFVITYKNVMDGDILFLPDAGKIANSAGITREQQLMLKFYEKIEMEPSIDDSKPDSGIIIVDKPVKKGYWEVTWG